MVAWKYNIIDNVCVLTKLEKTREKNTKLYFKSDCLSFQLNKAPQG